MEKRTSVFSKLGLPQGFGIVLLTFSFILMLWPYFPDTDFGIFKIPTISAEAIILLKIIGPIAFISFVFLFLPIIKHKEVENEYTYNEKWRVHLFNILTTNFSNEDLIRLYSQLGVRYDKIQGDIPEEELKSFLDYVERNHQLSELTSRMKILNPNISLDEINRFVRNQIVGSSIMESSVSVRFGADYDQFVSRLTKAKKVTIIGRTNLYLTRYLEKALEDKKKDSNKSNFWESIRIVFLSDNILNLIDDELSKEYPERDVANRIRIRNAGQAKRSISYTFLRAKKHADHWDLYEYNSTAPFIGTLFELADGQTIVEIAILAPNRSRARTLFIEYSSKKSPQIVNFYKDAFEGIIKKSEKQDEILVIGAPGPIDKGFIWQHSKFRRSVLVSKSHPDDWIAAVIILLWCELEGTPLPLLQIRTKDNATREINMLSNLAGYINHKDCKKFEDTLSTEIILQEPAIKSAVLRELKEELGIKNKPGLSPEIVNEVPFYNVGKENFYFYICQTKFDYHSVLNHSKTLLRPMEFSEILHIREYQVLSKVKKLLSKKLSEEQIILGTKVLANNLIIHGQSDLAGLLLLSKGNPQKKQSIVKKVDIQLEKRKNYYEYKGKLSVIRGLAELQYREFFSTILPAYAEIGIQGVSEFLENIRTDPACFEALEWLNTYYRDEHLLKKVSQEIK